MRIAGLIACGLTIMLLGGTCLPLVDDTARDPLTGKQIAVSLIEPTAARTLAQGDTVRIKWTAGNTTGAAATVTLTAESRTDLSRIALGDPVTISGTGGSGEYTWDTSAVRGPYVVIAKIQGATGERQVQTPLLTIDGPPSFQFTAPTADAKIDPNASPAEPITITWVGKDESATARIGLDPDAQHADPNDADEDERNEIYIRDVTLPKLTDPNAADPNSFAWNGKDVDGNVVAPGTYYLFAIVSDGVNANLTAESTARITVVPEPNEPNDPAFAINEPAEDVTFLTTDATLALEYQVNRTDDVYVDLKIDQDDNHANGNEIAILPQRFVEKESGTIAESWDGLDRLGAAVPIGMYKLVAYASTGSGNPTQAVSEGYIFRRSASDQPVLALLEPASNQTLNPGAFLTVKWRDDDPTETALLRIVLDDDAIPNEGTETGAAEIEILEGRSIKPDGVQDTFQYQIPLTLPPATYYVFGSTYRTDPAVPECTSTAAGRIVIKDPNNP